MLVVLFKLNEIAKRNYVEFKGDIDFCVVSWWGV